MTYIRKVKGDIKVITSDEVKRKLWSGANDLRGSMDASKYKDYMLSLMFYKFLSDKTMEMFKDIFIDDESQDAFIQYKESYEKNGNRLTAIMQSSLGYCIKPEYLYQKWVKDINSADFEIQNVIDGLNDFERSVAISDDSDDFKGLFTIDLTDTSLGNDQRTRHNNISKLIMLFADLDMIELQKGDVLGDAYEYLIGQFASDAGKKAGEFYTPRQVSEVMARIVAKTTNIKSIYDPTVGSGSLLLTVGRHLSKERQGELHYYGQEYITETYNLTRMNLLLHGVRPENMTIKNGNTLAQDWPEDPKHPGEGVQFDAVVMNPPYSDKKWNKHEETPLKVSDPRFADFGVLPPETKGDFAYLMHGLFHLGQQGTMAIVLPHGVLFRGDTESIIRKKLVDKNYIDAIIGMPSNMFTNTGIPVVVIILKKNRKLGAPVLIIDASNDFIKIGKNNVLRERDIAKIVDTYVNKIEIKNYSHLADSKEIKSNDYNLNIPRYVDSDYSELVQDVDGHLLGGIPREGIDKLRVIQNIAPEVINSAFEEIRPGYLKMKQDIGTLKQDILRNDKVKSKIDELSHDIKDFFDNYYRRLKEVDKSVELNKLKEDMLDNVKELLSKYSDVDEYAGYQIVAEIWDEYLENDLEFIINKGFYSAGRTRRPNMVTKGKGDKKYEKQEGWIGAIVPNKLIKEELFKDELNQIEMEKSKVSDFQIQLDEIKDTLSDEEGEFDVLNDDNSEFNQKEVKSELGEAIKNIDIPEISGLKDYLKFLDSSPDKRDKISYMSQHPSVHWSDIDKNKDGTVGKSNVNKRIKELKNNFEFPEGSFESKLVKIKTILECKKEYESKIKSQEKILDEEVYDKIEKLTDDEIEQLVYKKWFGSLLTKFVELIKDPVNEELVILNKLNTMYSVTVDDLDREIDNVETEIRKLLDELVVK